MKTKIYLLTIVLAILFTSCDDHPADSRFGTIHCDNPVLYTESTKTDISASLHTGVETSHIEWVGIKSIGIIDDEHPQGYAIPNPTLDDFYGQENQLSPTIESDYMVASIVEMPKKDFSNFTIKVNINENPGTTRVIYFDLYGFISDKDGSFPATGQFTIIQKGK